MKRNQKRTLLIGGGGHARSVVEAASPDRFAGYVAPEPADIPPGLPYEGDDEFITSVFSPADYDVHIAIGFNGNCRLETRRKVIELYSAYEPATVIAPSATVTPGSSIGHGTAVMAGAIVNRTATGNHCIINTGAILEHDCTLADNVFIGPGAIVCGEVTIGADTFIGAGAIVRQGLTIAPDVTVGMGAVVVSDITEPGVYVGSPARLITEKQS